MIEKFVRYELLRYKPRERTLPLDVHAHSLHMGIMWEERLRDLTAEDCQDKQTFLYFQTLVWNGS